MTTIFLIIYQSGKCFNFFRAIPERLIRPVDHGVLKYKLITGNETTQGVLAQTQSGWTLAPKVVLARTSYCYDMETLGFL